MASPEISSSMRWGTTLFYSNLSLANRYLAGIYGVAFGNVSPDVALEMANVPAKEELQ